MVRFGLKSAKPLAFVLGLACAVPAVTIAYAQDSRDPANERNIRDPADQRNIHDPADQRNIHDPANASNPNDKASKPGDK